ncbi:hypothetical protein [Methylomonas methanica]|uniref:Beta-lactamase-inhibitor-like PepSY-like domain-containing protein n=1 Tax=Methylomonas methanica (strain DSM 25384 / MC09) TaxID=857087 RepID=G0A1M5_METMM|nr:hypothetical protein [Methylomonas methanica]AEG00086.1 hypothetical protein Metme_1667 [Methylomonas methanica MC09]
MRKSLASTFGTGLLVLAVAAHAEAIHPASIPEIVKRDIMKRHPSAQNLQGSHETHFGKKLLEVSYKDADGQTLLELFTSHGDLFTNEILIEDIDEIQPRVIARLKKEFQQYAIQKAELIGNPNGVGEEYEIYLKAAGRNWKISITDQGVILDKQPEILKQKGLTKVIYVGAPI